MTTHLGARVAQAGAFLAMVGGVLAVASAPALADQPDVQIINISSTDLPSGGRTTMTYNVTNNNPVPGIVRVRVTGVTCSGECASISQLGPGDDRRFTAQLTAPEVDPGQTRTVQVQVSATVNNDTGQASQQLTVRGADKPTTVRQVIGRVRDSNGKPVPGASVGVRDSQGHSYTTTTNNDGRYQFRSTDQRPILAGALSVATVKQGFEAVSVSVQGGADKVINVPLTLRGGEAPTKAAPAATATSLPPTEEATDEATVPATEATSADTANAANNSGSSSLLFIILGALLVAAGVGAIVLVLMRRKSPADDFDDPDGGDVPAGVIPPSHGRFHDATRVGAAAGGMSEATMVAGPSLSDAPTMLQQPVPVDEEFPDPYGAPAPRAAYANGYGGGAYGGTVPAQPGGYDPGPPTQFGSPDDGAYPAYGGRSGGYEPQRYDEPTGRYRPEPDYGYRGGAEPGPPPARGRGESTGGYAAGGYGPERGSGPTGYGSWGAPAGGIDSGNGYGPPARDRGEYGGGDYGRGGGHGPSDGYGEQPYEPPGGYDDAGYDQRRPAYGGPDSSERRSDGYQPGYRDDRAYYGDEPGGRHGGQSRSQPPNPGQRRPLDWLDD